MRGSWRRWWPYCTLRPSHATAGAGVGGGLTARCCRVAFAFKLATSFSRHSGSWRRRMRAQREPRQPNTRPDSCAARARRGSWQPAEMESTHSSAPSRKKHRTGPLRLTVPVGGWRWYGVLAQLACRVRSVRSASSNQQLRGVRLLRGVFNTRRCCGVTAAIMNDASERRYSTAGLWFATTPLTASNAAVF